MTKHPDAVRWAEHFAREHEAVLADQGNVQQFLAALAALTMATGIEITATCDLRLERDGVILLDDIEWSTDVGYTGNIPD